MKLGNRIAGGGRCPRRKILVRRSAAVVGRDDTGDHETQAAAGHEACDQPIRSLEILNQCVPLFETLKDPNRQQLLVQLVCHGPQTVGELAESSALSRTAVSHHIKLLEQAGFIEISKDATRRICSVRADRWLPLLDELSSALKADLAAAEQCRA